MKRTALAFAFLLAALFSAHAVLFTPPIGVVKVAAAYSGPGDQVSGASAWWGLRGYNAAFSGTVANICDAATGATCGNATWAAGVLTLPTIGGSPCDNASNKCVINTLNDQTGNGFGLSQSTNSQRPTLVVAGAGNGCTTTSLPCLSFVKANSQCLFGSSTYTRAQPFSAAFVGNRTGTVGSAQVAISMSNANLFIGWSNGANTLEITAGTGRFLSANDNVWHAVQGVFSNSVGSLSADGTTSTANNGSNTSSSNIDVGTRSSGACLSNLDGLFAEGGVWPLAFSGTNISNLNSNAHSYWGF
jgi:hypothetical protein